MGRLVVTGMLAVLLAASIAAQDQAPNRREITVTGQNFRFTPDRIEVFENDLVKVTLRSADQPFTFVVDAYRIMKRVGGGKTVSFQFRADQPGTFPFYCNMSTDARCREMKGTLVVKAR